MPGTRQRFHLQRYLVFGLLVLAGCTRWRAQDVSPAQVLASRSPARIRVTRFDDSRVVLHRPQLVGDTIVDGRTRDGARTKVAVIDVAQVAVRKWDPFKITGLVLAAAAVGAIVTIGVIWDSRAD